MKKYLSGIIAIAAIFLSAFNMPETPDLTLDEQIWYDFSGTGESVLSNYSVDADNDPDCPNNGTVLCERLAFPIPVGQPNAGKPDLSRSYSDRRKI